MGNITLLDQATIDKIAAGEVVERPSSVVKELVENAIDAGATAITAEIRDGGISMIRISDNGCGIAPEDVRTAFLRHSTSKIRSAEDLMTIHSLGFRGEALSSIAAVSMVELLTKQRENVCGIRYTVEGSQEKSLEEAAAGDGTTFFVRNLFYNTPARRKFLKSAVTEGGYIHELMIRMALSHPEISFQLISNGQKKLHSSGNHNLKDLIYQVYGREITKSLYEIHTKAMGIEIHGFIGKPNVYRGNRNFETYFINGRYIKSNIITKAIEDAYKGYLMQHQYPFCVLHFSMDGDMLDVNVHPTKMELRFADQKQLYDLVFQTVKEGLEHKEYIIEARLTDREEKKDAPSLKTKIQEPVLKKSESQKTEFRKPELQKSADQKPEPLKSEEKSLDYFLEQMRARVKAEYESRPNPSPYQPKYQPRQEKTVLQESGKYYVKEKLEPPEKPDREQGSAPKQLELFEEKLLDQKSLVRHKIIGQLFGTYWLVEFDDKLFMIDQHAAHEKVLYEKTLRQFRNKEHTSQMISPPMVVTLSPQEEELLKKYQKQFTDLGYEIEHFGGAEYQICAVPGNLYSLGKKELFLEMLGELSEYSGRAPGDSILEKIASMSCKAAVKGNQELSRAEIEVLIKELLELENPYQCPHGRPTIISMSKYEIEKKFKRIVT